MSSRKTLAGVFVIRRTNKKDPKDTQLIYGAPGGCVGENYPADIVFITSDTRVAEKYANEMSERWGHTQTYTIEGREVRV
jgi:hypothetical protein